MIFSYCSLAVSDDSTLCRWSTNNGDPSLFVKYSKNLLNVLDAEKRVMLLTNSFQLAAETKYPRKEILFSKRFLLFCDCELIMELCFLFH